jgi:hypothetical protein
MKALQIVPVSRGKISSQALDELDELDKFMKNNPGAKIWEFPRNAEYESSEQLDKSTGQLDNFNETLQLVEAIARHGAANQDPLTKYKALEYAANHILLLPTSKVKELIGAKPSKSQFQRGTFVFTKTDIKIGRESAWRTQMIPNAFRPTPEYQTAPGDRWEKLHQSLNPGLEQTD